MFGVKLSTVVDVWFPGTVIVRVAPVLSVIVTWYVSTSSVLGGQLIIPEVSDICSGMITGFPTCSGPALSVCGKWIFIFTHDSVCRGAGRVVRHVEN